MNVAARVREEIQAGARTAVHALAGGDLSRVNATLVDEAWRSGDAYARALWDEVGELLGTAIANFLIAHASEFGIEDVIWRQQIWMPGFGWKGMSDRGSATANHYDHVHVKVY